MPRLPSAIRDELRQLRRSGRLTRETWRRLYIEASRIGNDALLDELVRVAPAE